MAASPVRPAIHSLVQEEDGHSGRAGGAEAGGGSGGEEEEAAVTEGKAGGALVSVHEILMAMEGMEGAGVQPWWSPAALTRLEVSRLAHVLGRMGACSLLHAGLLARWGR